jgi:tRNA (mo5U34)-methyltransferase
MNVRELIDSVPHWYHRFEFAPGVVTPGVNDSQTALAQLQLPSDLSGLRVLDIGARDGFFSFECERRGAADVVAIDYVPSEKTGFPVAKQILGSRLNLIHDNIYNLSRAKYGRFDVVLFLGLLYHLPDPMRALDIINEMMNVNGTLYMETVVIDDHLPPEVANRALMEFYPGSTKDNDRTNYWGITEQCARAMLLENTLACTATRRNGERGTFVAVKTSSDKDYYLRIARNLVGGPQGWLKVPDDPKVG